ncbi:class I SAM-dependent methyltransferase [Nocardioides insulae]|uniref:class I SAM-dependent methyltransferase n=1 Tax=Nocardioides insulae TaxID=394734 RepID=UPI00041A8DC9|nr:class I SAM-dependent methyltransferase [Nocardioides insulae]
MDPVEGAATFQRSGAEYDAFMGRYSRSLATLFADWAGVVAGQSALDVGCGPGALTGVLVQRLGPGGVLACDPSEPFVQECRARHPGVDVRRGRAEQLPCEDSSRDVVLAQLVLHFVSDPETAAAEMRRVLRPGGTVAACSWDFAQGMAMLRHFWDAATSLDPAAPDEAALRFGKEGELAELFEGAGFQQTSETTLEVTSSYVSFDDLWSGFLAGIGPAGQYAVTRPRDQQDALRRALFEQLGSPDGPFELRAVARAARGSAPPASAATSP